MKLKGFATLILLVLATSSSFAASNVWFSDGQCHEVSSDGDDLGVVNSQLCGGGGNTYQWLADGNCHIWTGGDTDGGTVSDQMCGGIIYQRFGDDTCHKMSRGGADRGVVAESYCGG
ncbi:hypothetical protein AAAA73_06865 [Bdellovibrio sp. GT3]